MSGVPEELLLASTYRQNAVATSGCARAGNGPGANVFHTTVTPTLIPKRIVSASAHSPRQPGWQGGGDAAKQGNVKWEEFGECGEEKGKWLDVGELVPQALWPEANSNYCLFVG